MVTRGVEMSEGLADVYSGSFFKVYPNPTSDIFYLELDPAVGNQKTEIQIFNMMGDMIQHREVTDNNGHSFSLGEKAPGIYFIRAISGERMEMKKIVRK